MVARRTIRNSVPVILMLAACLLCSLVSAVRMMSGGDYVNLNLCDMFVHHNLTYHTNVCSSQLDVPY